MGEVSEDILDGTVCSLCGQYFQDPKDKHKCFTHGYPVVCKKCYTPDMHSAQKAIVNTI